MAKLGIDVSAVKSPFDPIPEDNYTLKVEDAELTQAKKTGAPMIKITFVVVGHEKLAGRKLFHYALLEQTSGQFIINQLAQASGDDPTDPDPEAWKGVEVPAEVTIQEGDQGPQNRVLLLVDVSGRATEEETVEV